MQVEFTTAAASSNFTSGWYPTDISVTPFNLSWFLNRSGVGGVHSLIEGTLSDSLASAAVAFTLADVSSNGGGGATAAAYTTPITAIRVTSSASAASTLTFRALQVGT